MWAAWRSLRDCRSWNAGSARPQLLVRSVTAERASLDLSKVGRLAPRPWAAQRARCAPALFQNLRRRLSTTFRHNSITVGWASPYLGPHAMRSKRTRGVETRRRDAAWHAQLASPSAHNPNPGVPPLTAAPHRCSRCTTACSSSPMRRRRWVSLASGCLRLRSFPRQGPSDWQQRRGAWGRSQRRSGLVAEAGCSTGGMGAWAGPAAATGRWPCGAQGSGSA